MQLTDCWREESGISIVLERLPLGHGQSGFFTSSSEQGLLGWSIEHSNGCIMVPGTSDPIHVQVRFDVKSEKIQDNL